MSSFRKIIYSSLFFITACGFSPLYTSNDPSLLIGQIRIQEPNSQDEFIFYSRLVDRFGQAGDKYILNYAITSAKEDRALNFDGTAHRVEIFGSVSFSLKEKEIELLNDEEEMYLSYSNSGSTAAVLNAERDTNKQLVILLADKVADRISLTIVEENL
tara:strand:- start:153 stop:626 length:474 start_codon:yes stop_codon:yes gene_type:complete